VRKDRRRFLRAVPAASGAGALALTPAARAAARGRDWLAELGVPAVINACGVFTAVTGTLMWPEVVAAMASVSRRYVRLDDLHRAVGARIARRLGVEAALVTSGAAAALTIGTAACIAGDRPDAIRRLPDLTGLKSEVIVQRSHRNPYDHAVRNCGVRLVEVETTAELERAVGPRTAMMLFLNKAEPQGAIKAPEFVALGKKHGVPTFVDAAADLPPVENLSRLPRLGFDLVTFSGGKGLRGPQSAGLLLGRRDLVEAALLHTGASSDSIGRPMKVSKEEIVGMMVALEKYLDRDHAADWRRWEADLRAIERALSGLRGVTCERVLPVIANQVPHLRVTWDRGARPVTQADVVQRLRRGPPSIEVVPDDSGADHVLLAAWTLEPGEAAVVGRRLRAALASDGGTRG
jgi:L-seryl-tRNA(Ser) seleniumtransferase